MRIASAVHPVAVGPPLVPLELPRCAPTPIAHVAPNARVETPVNAVLLPPRRGAPTLPAPAAPIANAVLLAPVVQNKQSHSGNNRRMCGFAVCCMPPSPIRSLVYGVWCVGYTEYNLIFDVW